MSDSVFIDRHKTQRADKLEQCTPERSGRARGPETEALAASDGVAAIVSLTEALLFFEYWGGVKSQA